MQIRSRLQTQKVIQWHQTCTASAMSRSIWVSVLCLCHRNTQSCWKIQMERSLLQSRQRSLGRVSSSVRFCPTRKDPFQPPPLVSIFKPPSAMILLWSARRQPECCWLRAYNVSSSRVLELSSSPDLYLLLVVKRQALHQHKDPFLLWHIRQQRVSVYRCAPRVKVL